jgi:hypothetical protein
MVSPLTIVSDEPGGIIRRLVAASLSRLNRGEQLPRPTGLIRLNLDVIAY